MAHPSEKVSGIVFQFSYSCSGCQKLARTATIFDTGLVLDLLRTNKGVDLNQPDIYYVSLMTLGPLFIIHQIMYVDKTGTQKVCPPLSETFPPPPTEIKSLVHQAHGILHHPGANIRHLSSN